jgi:hypothetical protein
MVVPNELLELGMWKETDHSHTYKFHMKYCFAVMSDKFNVGRSCTYVRSSSQK